MNSSWREIVRNCVQVILTFIRSQLEFSAMLGKTVEDQVMSPDEVEGQKKRAILTKQS